MKLVSATIEIISNPDQSMLSVTSNDEKDPITFPLDPLSRDVFLKSSEINYNDPRSLTQFRIMGLSKRMDSFECDSILQFHRLFASSGEGLEEGLFSSPDLPRAEPITWVRVSQEFTYDHEAMLEKIYQARINSNTMTHSRCRPNTPPPTYNQAIKRFPMAYYRPEDVHTFPVYTIPTTPELDRNVSSFDGISSREQHDTFLPPYGMPLSFPVSLGFGAEVGLEEDIQELFDPTDNSLFYLNHKNYKFMVDDPRVRPLVQDRPILSQIIKLKRAACSIPISNLSFDDIPLSTCQAEKMASLAASRWEKYGGYMVKMCGEDDKCGHNGIPGQRGFFGCRGADGRFYGGPGDKGQDGDDGASGSNGSPGGDSTNGSDLYIDLDGDSNRLLLSGDIEDTLDMGGDDSSILYIDISGGKGGKGGRGGHGGFGGRGGMGGHGHKGMGGIDAMIPGGGGGAGQSGGRGGRGGTGGNGGNGGIGGEGGNGGNGGRLIISCKNPALFSLVEVNCRGGEGGRGGKGGNGGERGEGGKGGGAGDSGRGGMGGPGTDDSTAGFHGSAGKVGVVGENGKPGSGGYRGASGKQGECGTPGSVLWVVLREDGSIKHSGSTKFNLEMTEDSVCINSAVDDDIFEPNERIHVSGITLLNSGDIPLSAGAKLRIMSSDTINFENKFVTLPEITPGMAHHVNEVLFGRIFDIPPPNTKEAFQSSATFTIQVDLNNRLLTESTAQETIKVQYPITIKNVTYPEVQARGKACHMKISLQNVSNKHYGTSNSSGGYVSLEIHLDKRLVPVGYANNLANKEYAVYYDHNKADSLVVVVKELKPKGCLLVQLNLFLVPDAEIYDKVLFQINLLLRQKLIQYRYGYAEVSPGKLSPKDYPDNCALLVVSLSSLNRLEFLFWESILSGLGLDIQYWDLSSYRSFQTQMHEDSEEQIDSATDWIKLFRGKLVIFPHANLSKISVPEIISFFHGDDWRRGQDVDCDSGMFFLMNNHDEESNRVTLIQKLCNVCLCDERPVAKLTDRQASNILKTAQQNPRNLVFPHCVINPTSELWKKKCKVVRLMFSNKTALPPLSSDDRDIFVVEFPLARYVNFFMLDVKIPWRENFKFDNPHIEPQFDSVPFGSNLGQSILCVVSALPTSMKIRILMTLNSAPLPCMRWKLVTPSGFSLNIFDLINMTLSNDLIKEIRYSQNELKRFEFFRETVCSFPHQFTEPPFTTARCTMAVIKEVSNFAKKYLKLRSEKRTYVECGCGQMSQRLRQSLDDISRRTLLVETEKSLFLTLDVFFDHKTIFTPDQLHPYDGYSKQD